MIDVYIPLRLQHGESTDVKIKLSMQDENGFAEPLRGFADKKGVWHFESKALIPGIPHIYVIKFEHVRIKEIPNELHGKRIITLEEEKVRDLGMRHVRLIPGRITELHFMRVRKVLDE